MKHVVVALMVAILAFVAAPQADAWTPPDECADEDRVVPGNRGSPCKLTLPEMLEDVQYGVVMEYPNCVEEISFSVPGARSSANDVEVEAEFMRFDPQKPNFPEGYRLISVRATPDRVHLRGYVWDLTSSITGSLFMVEARNPLATTFRVGLWVGDPYHYVEHRAGEGPMPDVGAVYELANTCLAEVRLEQAKREAEAQAERARVVQAAALQTKLLAAEEELVKTEALQAQIEHEETIAVILRDIVRIRLAGQEDRARLTNEYMTRLEAAQSAFAGEVSEVEARIQQYLDFNAQLLARIEEYQQAIDARLAETETSLEEQRAAIEEIAQDREELSSTPNSTERCESYLATVEDGRASGLTDIQIVAALLGEGFTLEEIHTFDSEC